MLKKLSLSAAVLSIALTIPAFAAKKYNSSDVIRYALTVHGSKYLLRDRKGAVNAWEVNKSKSMKAKTTSRAIWGNTDCSGLVSAAWRLNGYKHPSKKGKFAITTYAIRESAKKGKYGLSFVGNSKTFKTNAKHGDAFNRRVKKGGHVFLYNGLAGGKVSTIEAKCSKCGNGRFTRSWNSIVKNGYKLVRNKNIHNDVSNKSRAFKVSEMSATKTTIGKSGSATTVTTTKPAKVTKPTKPAKTTGTKYITVKRGDHSGKIAKRAGISSKQLMRLNPNVNWRRLKIGQKLVIAKGTSSSASSRPAATTSSSRDYVKVKRGDTFGKIAKRNGLSVKQLKRLNPKIKNIRVIRIGQKIYVN